MVKKVTGPACEEGRREPGIDKGKEEDTKVFVGNNTHQRDDINRLSQILEGHLKRVTNITFE